MKETIGQETLLIIKQKASKLNMRHTSWTNILFLPTDNSK